MPINASISPSKPTAVAATVVTFTNTYTGTAPLNYQWLDGSLRATNNTVGGYDLAAGYATNTGTVPLSYQWYFTDGNTNIFVGPSYPIQLPKSFPDTNYWLQTKAPNERTNYSMLILKTAPGMNYYLQIIEPNEGTNYALQIIHE